MLRAWALRVRGIISRAEDERDFADQIQADIELHTEDGVRAGMSPEEARRAALVKVGGIGAATEAWRDRHGVPFLEALMRDVAYAFRVLRRNKGWTSVAVVSLALGVGANTAVFGAIRSVFLRSLPVPDARELVTLRWQGEGKAFTSFVDYGFVPGGGVVALLAENTEFSLDSIRAGATGAYETFQRLRTANRTLSHLFAVAKGPTVNLIVDGRGDTASSLFVSGEFFSALRIPPAAGRPILPADDRRGAVPVAVISDGYWERRFGRDPAIVGKQVRVNAVAFTIVGISGKTLPNVLELGNDVAELTLPLATEPVFQAGTSRLNEPTSWWLVMMGRLKTGATIVQVQANLAPVYEQAGREAAATFLGTLAPEDRKEAITYGLGQQIPRLHVVAGARGAYDMLPMFRAPLAILGALVVIVLLVVSANLTNLSLALARTRERETAVRRALGATRSRLVRQTLTEHVVMAVLGGAASLLAAYLFHSLIRLWFPTQFDWTVVVFAFVAATATGIAIGVLPALRASRTPERAPTGGGSSRSRSRLAATLLVAQVAMSLALLVGAGLFVRTLVNLQHVDPGFDSSHLVLFSVEPGFNQYDEARTEALYRELTANLRALPGVSLATFSSHSLLSGAGNTNDLYAQGEESATAQHGAYRLVVQQDFFDTMRIPLRMGRSFTDRDDKKAPKVVVINETLAKTLFGDANPLGRRIGLDKDDSEAAETFEVVGVVADTRHKNLRDAPPRIFYSPHLQSDSGPRTFEVRTRNPPEDLMPAIRQVVQTYDPALPILSLSTQASAIANLWIQERIIALASGTLGGLALMVSVIGLFGVMSYAVARRTKDIGIRMALGAQRRGVLQSILRESLILVGSGVLIGLAATVAATRFLKTLLFGLAPNDPTVIGVAIGLMLSVAAVASYLPARRAAKVDPLVALRHE
jgi:predicted permease